MSRTPAEMQHVKAALAPFLATVGGRDLSSETATPDGTSPQTSGTSPARFSPASRRPPVQALVPPDGPADGPPQVVALLRELPCTFEGCDGRERVERWSDGYDRVRPCDACRLRRKVRDALAYLDPDKGQNEATLRALYTQHRDRFEPCSGAEEALRAQAAVIERPWVNRGLVLLGPVGTGKSRIAWDAMRAVLARHPTWSTTGEPMRALWVPNSALKSAFRLKYSDDKRAKSWGFALHEAAKAVPFLVLDDLGADVDRRSNWLDELQDLLTRRHDAGRCTVISSNLSWDALVDTETGLGPRIASRLVDACKCRGIVVRGRDRREVTP